MNLKPSGKFDKVGRDIVYLPMNHVLFQSAREYAESTGHPGAVGALEIVITFDTGKQIVIRPNRG